ncbi:MAG: S-adenosyl-methyltransferase [Flavobacteriaceae bacterium]|nr:MAG: S-adenosyl-methyltransferase [Flavobacteriaceae bacterium]
MALINNWFFNVLKGKFLTEEEGMRNWRVIFFVVILILIMISSSHSSDAKVMEIAKLNKEIKELQAYFVDTRTISMQLRLESGIKKRVDTLGLGPSVVPPILIRVIDKTAQ